MAATIKAATSKQAPDLERIFRLSRTVCREMLVMSRTIPMGVTVRVAIEYPVMKGGHVTNYRKQVNTMYAYEHEMLAQDFGVELVEINPIEVKMAATGDSKATKADIITASPFTGTGHTIETMADAWAVAKAGMLAKNPLKLVGLKRSTYQIEAREEVL